MASNESTQSTLNNWIQSNNIDETIPLETSTPIVRPKHSTNPYRPPREKRPHEQLSDSSDQSSLMYDKVNKISDSQKLDYIFRKVTEHDTLLQKLNKLDTIENDVKNLANRVTQIETNTGKNTVDIEKISQA